MRLILIFCLIGCQFIDENHFEVDPLLKDSVDSFMEEANKRDVSIRTDNLQVIIGEIETCGLYRSGIVQTITINSSFFQYGKPDSIALQYMVFHEFGHLMGRNHNDVFSIMNPNKYAGEYKNDPLKRIELINELFK